MKSLAARFCKKHGMPRIVTDCVSHRKILFSERLSVALCSNALLSRVCLFANDSLICCQGNIETLICEWQGFLSSEAWFWGAVA